MGMEGFGKNLRSTAPETAQFLDTNKESLGYSPEGEAREILHHIDQETLRGIFDEMRVRSGTQERSNFVSLNRIQFDPEMGMASGRYDRGDITMDPGSIARESSPDNFRSNFLRLLVHEETHASAKNIDCSGPLRSLVVKTVSNLTGEEQALDISGYQRRMYKRNIHEQPAGTILSQLAERNDFHGFNEGVTEKIARQVFEEYLKRTGDTSYFVNKDGEIVPPSFYADEVGFMDLFLQTLSSVCEIPKDKIWEGITAGYMSGVDLNSTELRKFFEGSFGPFITSVVKSKIFLSAEEFAEEMRNLPVSEAQKKSLLETLASLPGKSL